ncbi:site-specific integrase [Agrobacterium tumefaciens]|uniref:site-specific integrase n=1 Tax=Agrobacterium tumefaciens TaxID=358 RepID=UPI001575FDA1|nr:site-specific integrase [Agrobacterium tumefaciens]NTZ89278.1 site-specific integrase [Agrobacterium tumefaciens]
MRSTDDASSLGDLPPLPEKVMTRDGMIFYPRPDRWSLSGLSRKQTFKFEEFDHLSIGIVLRLKWLLIKVLEEKSFAHSCNLFTTFLLFYRSVLSTTNSSCERLELTHVLSFKATLNASTEWKLGILRIVLADMSRLGFGIASDEVLEYLASSTIAGNIKGTSIRTRDPNTGAFSDTELLAIQSSLNDAYASGEINLHGFAIVWLFLAYGCRPIQIAAMKEKDLLVSATADVKAYALRIPRAKQSGRGHRDVFNARYCSKPIGALLERVIKENAARRTELGLEAGDAPLFMAHKVGELVDLEYHRTAQSIGVTVNEGIKRLTGLKGNPKRFRITLGQRAADDGKDKWTVAELLDHSDTQNVEVYFEASPAMVLRLDRHLAMELAPLAQAFAGVVVETEEAARRGSDGTSRIYDRSLVDNVTNPLGICGQMSFCGLGAPFACYTCRHFQPWIDGPHEEFMAAMVADRKRMEDDGISPKIFTIRDRAILAAAEIIQLCSMEREARRAVT